MNLHWNTSFSGILDMIRYWNSNHSLSSKRRTAARDQGSTLVWTLTLLRVWTNYAPPRHDWRHTSWPSINHVCTDIRWVGPTPESVHRHLIRSLWPDKHEPTSEQMGVCGFRHEPTSTRKFSNTPPTTRGGIEKLCETWRITQTMGVWCVVLSIISCVEEKIEVENVWMGVLWKN